ncbi:hypothetical protein UlMin_010388 [Ulmus minor]
MMPARRKKWTEAEERTLIDKYGEMVSDGSLSKMKTREKKFKPIASYVNSVHYVQDPIAYPWQWSWKDVSTKVQNMRHQYLLVKQKIKKQSPPECSSGSGGGGDCSVEEFDWLEGLTHWSNFLRYKEVFGDVGIVNSNGNDLMAVGNGDGENGGGFVGGGMGLELVEFGQMGHSGDAEFGAGIDGVENGVMGLGFEYDGEEAEENYNGNGNGRVREDVDDGFVYEEVEANGSHLKKKKKKMLKGLGKKAWRLLGTQLGKLRETETRFDQREVERERERQRRESLRMDREREWERRLEEREKEREEREKCKDKLRVQRIKEWEVTEKENEERERRRREEELIYEREWEERMNRRRIEWKKRIDEMLSQHRDEMGQMQTRILHEQQNLTNQLLGLVSQWTAHPAALSDHTSASNHYLSQMMQNLHHVNSLVHDDTRVEGENQDDQFIVDG